MARFSRGNYWIDGLALVGLVLIGAAVFLAAGLAATLGYAGGALLVVAVVLSQLIAPMRDAHPKDKYAAELAAAEKKILAVASVGCGLTLLATILAAYSGQQLAATLAYVGVALLAVAVVLALVPDGRVQ